MPRAATVSLGLASRQSGWDEIFGWTVGAAFTFGLFFAMAHFENVGGQEPPSEIEDVRMVAMPFEPPPPPPTMEEPVVAPEEVPPLVGIDAGASDSPVRIAVIPRDLEALCDGVEMAAQIFDSSMMNRVLAKERSPRWSSRDELREMVRLSVDTTFHPSSSCRMGRGREDSVVDQYCRVHDVEGLRVIDTSIMPNVVRRCPAATAIMIGERAAAFF